MPSQEYAARLALLERLGRGPSVEERLLSALALPPRADFLDLGAGDGRLLSSLWKSGHEGRLVGLDLHFAQAPGVEWIVGVVEALPFPDASFDAVCFLRSLPHALSPERALREAWRVLREGGHLFAAVNGSHHLARFWDEVARATAFLPGWQVAPAGNGPSLEARLIVPFQSVGLEPQFQVLSAPLVFTAADALTLLGTYRPTFDVDDQAWEVGESAARQAFEKLGDFEDAAELVLLRVTKVSVTKE